MENAAEALKLAGWVLIFVVALSITINAFTQARESTDAILAMTDREYLQTHLEGKWNGQVREVGFADIVKSVKNAFINNYEIEFKNNGATAPIAILDYYANSGAIGKEICRISKENIKLGDGETEDFIKALFGDAEARNKFAGRLSFKVDLYNYIQNQKFNEYIGLYYQDETKTRKEEEKESKRSNPTASQDDNINKTDVILITYEKI